MDTKNKPIKILQWNIGGLRNHLPFLKDSLYRDQIDIAILQETIYEGINIKFPGYQIYTTSYSRRGPRGLMTLVKNSIPSHKTKQPATLGHNIESLAISIHLQEEIIDIYNCYRPPRNNCILELDELFSIAENSPILLGGDFNAHHPLFNDPTSYRPLLKDPPGIHIEHHLSNSLHIQILNKTKATHIRGGVLDLTFTNDYLASNANSSFHEHLNSDHSALIITIEIPRMNSPPYQPKWNTHKANWGRFQKLIEIWASSYQIGDKTLDKLEEDFKTAITEAANSAIPLCKPFSKEHQDHWYYSNRVAELHHRVNITVNKRPPNLFTLPSKLQSN